MRIVVDLQSAQNGSRHRGIGRYARSLTKAMIAAGHNHEFLILLSDAFPDTIREVRAEFEGIVPQEHIFVFSSPGHAASVPPLNAWRNTAAELTRSDFVAALKPDAVFVASLFDGFWDDVIVSVTPSEDYVTGFTLYDLIPFEDPDRYLPAAEDIAAYSRRMFQAHLADLVFPISEYVGGLAVDQLGADPAAVVTVPCAVDANFRPRIFAAGEREALLDRYGIKAPFVLNTSPLEYRKNIEGLIAGFASMDSAVREQHQLVIVGKFDSFGRRYLTDLATREGLVAGALVLTGFVSDEDLIGLYSCCALFAFPSLSEGFGLPILEAMACGAPVIGSSTTSIPEVIGREDLLCDPEDAQSIASVMQYVLQNPQLQGTLRAYGVDRAKIFSWEMSAGRALAAFENRHQQRLADRHASPSLDMECLTQSRAKLAYVTPTMSAAHRLSACNGALIKELARHFDVTLICQHRNGVELNVSANHEIKGFDWFTKCSDRFPNVVYATAADAPLELLSLMAAIPGAIVVFDAPDLKLSDENRSLEIPASFQHSVLSERGLEGLVALVNGKLDGAALRDLSVARLVRLSNGAAFIEESCASIPVDLDRLPSISVQHSKFAADQFFAKSGLAKDQKVIVGFAGSQSDEAVIMRAFRASVGGRDNDCTLVLYSADRTSPKVDVDSDMKLHSLFGQVVQAGPLDMSQYRGVMSSAILCVASPRCDRWLIEHLPLDAAALGLPYIELTSNLAGLTEAMDNALNEKPFDLSLDHQNMTREMLIAARECADTIRRVMTKFTGKKPASPRLAFARSLPESVRGVRPDGADLGRLAIALSRNEAVNRPPVTLIDVSSFAVANSRRRLDASIRIFLKNLFGSVQPNARAVYAQGDDWVLANQFVGKVIGLRSCSLQDEIIAIRPGDRIVGVDYFESFQPIAHAALAYAQNAGALLLYNCIGYLPLEAPELAKYVATLIELWGTECRGSVKSYIWVGSQAADSGYSSAGNLAALNTVRGLTHDGISTHILVSDVHSKLPDQIAAELGFDKVVLSSGTTEVLEKLTAARQTPSFLRTMSSTSDVPNYVVMGHLLGTYSLAIINRNLARTLEEAHPGTVRFMPVETVAIDHTEGVPVSDKPLMMELSARPAPAADEILISHHYPVLVPEGSHRLSLAVFFWEETHVPVKTVEVLERGFDAIISPTSSVTKALLDSGLSIPIATIGQPVDMSPYRVLADAEPFKNPKCTFLHVSSCFRRKGLDVLLAAWVRAFTNADPVRLVIKTFPNPHNDVEEQVATLGREHPDHAEIVIINRDVEAEDMLQFYADADVMVLPSRGEGYNLPALEAMSAGLPLIVTGFGGHRDFCGAEEARLLKYTFAPTASHVGGGHSMWVDPDIDDLVSALKEFIDERQREAISMRRDHARKAAAVESDRGAWLRRNASAISDLLNMPVGGPPRMAWISTWNVQCGIAQYSEYLIDGLSASQKEQMVILCDERTKPDASSSIVHDQLWTIGAAPKAELLSQAVADQKVEAIVIQHQDGLISWQELGRMGRDPAFTERVTVAVLHNARNMRRLGGEDLAEVLDGLAGLSRIVVHNLSDVNYLLTLGLWRNVTLIPHGAFAPSQAPWPRALDKDDAPLLGCHGFFFRHKGIDKLIIAAAELRKEWPGLRLRLVNARFPDPGHDVYIDECRMLAARLGMTDAIEWYFDFLPREKINQLLSECDVIVLPYDESDDSASGAVRVSLSSMVPLVATRVQIFAELNDSVAWADSNDPNDLVNVLAPLLRSPEKRRTVQAAMHGWLTEHDWTKIAKTLEGMIVGLVKQKRLGWGAERN